MAPRLILTPFCAAFLAGACFGAGGAAAPGKAQDEQIIHVLNRTSFGLRPGEVEVVKKKGLQAYLQEQLHPEQLDDSEVEAQLQGFRLLSLSQSDLHRLYYDTRQLRREITNALYAERRKREGGSAMEDATMEESPAQNKMNERRIRAVMEEKASDLMKWAGNYNAAVTELSHAKLIRAINSPRQLQEVLVDFWGNHFNIDVKKNICLVYKVADDREVIRPHVFGKFRDMLEASAKSPAMLFYLDNVQNSAPMTEDGNAGKKKKKDREEMMGDGSMEMTMEMAGNPPPKQKKRGQGINENYAREIMELHTMGVDGGYTQEDVQEVARCFTGWTVDRRTGLFVFDPKRHDNGTKNVLGRIVPAGGGIRDGETVIDILCKHPSTARHIAFKLCQRFVSDEPPPGLVEKVAAVFTKTEGDLRAVTEAVLTSREFLDPTNYGNKIKSPFEFAVSAVRTSGARYVENRPVGKASRSPETGAVLGRAGAAETYEKARQQSLNYHVFLLGQPLFACTPPTGYKETSDVWVNPGALIARLNFAMALTGGKVGDVRFAAKDLVASADLDEPQAMLDQCVRSLLHNGASQSTKDVLTKAALPQKDGQTVDPNKLVALVIGSPEFQRK